MLTVVLYWSFVLFVGPTKLTAIYLGLAGIGLVLLGAGTRYSFEDVITERHVSFVVIFAMAVVTTAMAQVDPHPSVFSTAWEGIREFFGAEPPEPTAWTRIHYFLWNDKYSWWEDDAFWYWFCVLLGGAAFFGRDLWRKAEAAWDGGGSSSMAARSGMSLGKAVILFLLGSSLVRQATAGRRAIGRRG